MRIPCPIGATRTKYRHEPWRVRAFLCVWANRVTRMRIARAFRLGGGYFPLDCEFIPVLLLRVSRFDLQSLGRRLPSEIILPQGCRTPWRWQVLVGVLRALRWRCQGSNDQCVFPLGSAPSRRECAGAVEIRKKSGRPPQTISSFGPSGHAFRIEITIADSSL